MAQYYRPGTGQPRSRMAAGDILINTSTFKPAHCGIVVAGLDVIHATGKGIRTDDIDLWGSEADVFRPAPVLTATELGNVCNVANEIKNSAQYGITRAGIKSTFSTGSVGTGARARLDKYRQRLENAQGVVKNVFCSELTILCYQLAWIKGSHVDEGHRLFIALDGKHTWPSTLRRYLNQNPNWQLMGQYVPQ